MRDFYKELAEYVDRSPRIVEVRCSYASNELAWIFPYYDDVISYYKDTDLYIFALSAYQTRLQEYKFHQWFKNAIKFRKWKTMLDFGGGIGEASIIGAKEGMEVVYQDVAGSKTADYALHRFYKHRIKQPELWDENHNIDRKFDVIVAMDVLEHLEDPEKVIKEMARSTEWLICNPNLVLYTEKYPEHISRPDITPYFEQVSTYLWKGKNEKTKTITHI